MHKTERSGVQGLSRAEGKGILDELLVLGRGLSTQDFKAPVAFIGKERMTDMFHVGANLMRPTSFQHTLHPRHRAKALQYTPMSHSGLAYLTFRRKDRHALAILGVAGNITLYPTLVLIKTAPNKGVILSAC